MFVHYNQTKGNSKAYEYCALSESVREPGKSYPERKLVISLGKFSLPEEKWRLFASLFEQRVRPKSHPVQVALFDPDPEVTALVEDYYKIYVKKFGEQPMPIKHPEKEEDQPLHHRFRRQPIQVEMGPARSLGCELVAHKFWRQVGLDGILQELGFSSYERAISQQMVAARLIEPGAEAASWEWIRQSSTLRELTGEEKTGHNQFYQIADRLLEHSADIEARLYSHIRTLFQPATTLCLFDLTNTYFEGSYPTSTIAKFGKSKEKRSDCKLVSLAVAVDDNQFPMYSRIYSGSQSEPQTLPQVLDDLEDRQKKNGILETCKMILVMDKGIASKDNCRLIRERGHDYVIAYRGNAVERYASEFAQPREGFQTIPKRAGGTVDVRKIMEEDGTCSVLCVSNDRKKKEDSIDGSRENKIELCLLAVKESIQKGRLKNRDQVMMKLGRIQEKYSSLFQYYTIKVISDERGQCSDLKWKCSQEMEQKRERNGNYVLNTTLTHLEASEIWYHYTSLTKVEGAFRDLKSNLGFRPVHHHSQKRVEGHLFVSVMAYTLLNMIEKSMVRHGDKSTWSTIKRRLRSHTRAVVKVNRGEEWSEQLVSGQPSKEQRAIYEKLGVDNPLIDRELKRSRKKE